jgi:hypothetical protein
LLQASCHGTGGRRYRRGELWSLPRLRAFEGGRKKREDQDALVGSRELRFKVLLQAS